MTQQVVKVGVIGVGSFGQHHARIYAEHSDAVLVGVLDQSIDRAHEIAQRHGCGEFSELEPLLAAVDAVSLATPAVNHAEIAMQCLDLGIHVLVEKPIATTVDDARRCVELAERRNCIYQVGHLERFNSALVEIQRMITTPYFIDCHRLSGFPGRGADVDVVLDVMIHDLDILLWLVGSEVETVQASGVTVQSSGLDIANSRITFCNGCVAHVAASRVSDDKIRTMTIAQPENVLLVNHASGTVRVYSSLQSVQANDERLVHTVVGHDEEPLWKELDSFLGCIQNSISPLVSGQDGLAALQLAHRIKAEIHTPSAHMEQTSSHPRTATVGEPHPLIR